MPYDAGARIVPDLGDMISQLKDIEDGFSTIPSLIR